MRDIGRRKLLQNVLLLVGVTATPLASAGPLFAGPGALPIGTKMLHGYGSQNLGA